MKSPFKFLDSYTKDDRSIFFGRDREIEELYQRVFDSKLLLVYGVSGTGKSSLIHCGLANKFLETDWLPLVIRRGGNIIESVAAAVSSASLTKQQNKFTSPGDFKKAVRSLYLDHYKPVFFIFDQFEELFIFGDKEERRSFIHIVKSLTESDLQCRMIFVMREEYMAGITEFEKFIPTIFSNRVRIEKMSHRNALEAIKEPCKVFNISLEEGFAESLLEKLSPGETDVELTYLQVFLDKIFRLATGFLPPLGGELKGGSVQPAGGSDLSAGESSSTSTPTPAPTLTFTLSLLSRTGKVSDLLGSFLDDQIALMEDPDTAMSVLKAFVSGKGTKRPASEPEAIDNIRSFGKEISPEKVKELIQSFVKLRVLRDKDENGRYELRHDALAEKVYEKFSTAEKELLEIRQFIENAYQSYLKRQTLLNNDDISYISGKDSLLHLNTELREFLEKSRKQQLLQSRSVKRLIAASFISFLLLIGFFGYYGITKISDIAADYQGIRLMTYSTDPVNRLAAATKLWNKNQGAIQKEVMLKTFNSILETPGNDSLSFVLSEKYSINFEPAPVPIRFINLSKDGKYIYGYGDSLIIIWKNSGMIERTIVTSDTPVISLKMSDNNQYIGALCKDSILNIWNLAGDKELSVKVQYTKVNTRKVFSFTCDNNIIFLSDTFDAVLMDLKGNIIQTFGKHKSRVNAVDISPDNNFIATASCDSTINIWYYNSVRKSYAFYNSLTWHKDTVWSVSFFDNINVTSASSDGYFICGNINREINFHRGILYLNEDVSSYYLNLKCCYAEITNSGEGIIALSYSPDNKDLDRFYYAYNRFNPKWDINNREGTDSPSRLTDLAFSEDGDYYACTEKDRIFLVDNRLGVERNKLNIKSTYTLMEHEGCNPRFTKDNKYLLYTDGEKISCYYIDTKTISESSLTIAE